MANLRLLAPTPRLGLAWPALLAWLLVMAQALPLRAGQVALEMTTHARAVEGQASIVLVVTNRGDDIAANLQAAPMPPWTGQASPLDGPLAPGQSLELPLAVDLPPGPPGRRALPLRLDFQDMNQFPYSALTYAYCPAGADRASPLAARPLPLAMDHRGTLEVELTNTEERPIELQWRALAPRELALDASLRRVELGAKSSRRVALEVSAVTSQLPADLAVLIWTAYDLDGIRLEKIVEAPVRLAQEENFFRRTLAWWLGAAGLALLWVIAAQLRRRRRP